MQAVQEPASAQPQPQLQQPEAQDQPPPCSHAAAGPAPSSSGPEAAASAPVNNVFANRRPGWQLPQLHEGLQTDDDAVLFAHKGRQPCPKCKKSRSLYCYDCLVALTPTPRVELPFAFSIITHAEELASKNTGVQAAILAPGSIQMHDIDHCPPMDASRCVVLFPSDDAVEPGQLEVDSIDRAIIIDSKWKKAKVLNLHPSLAGMRRVKLSNTRSAFWRFHTKGVADEGVCTIEAMYFFLKALAEEGKLSDPRFAQPHCFDNLLWYFVHQHKVIEQAAAEKKVDRTAAATDRQQQPHGQRQAKRQKRGGADGDQGQGAVGREEGSGNGVTE